MQTAIRWALCIVGIEVVFLLALRAGQLGIVPPLAASCLLLAANPAGVFARPRTLLLAYMVVGHLALVNSVFFGSALLGLFVMTLVAVGLMAVIPCIHPPAIALLFFVAQSKTPFRAYFVTLALVGVALAIHLLGQWWIEQLYKRGKYASTVWQTTDPGGTRRIPPTGSDDLVSASTWDPHAVAYSDRR